jgi:serine/threonine-protein kinase
MAYHLYESYRNYERASVQVELAQKVFPNSPEALWLAGRIYGRLGRWDDSIKVLEKAFSLDPRNPDVAANLFFSYQAVRRYREAEQMTHRLAEIEPGSADSTNKALAEFDRTGDPMTLRAALDQLPPSTKDHEPLASRRFWLALYARDWTAAKQLLDMNPGEDLFVGDQVYIKVPRRCGEIYLAALQGQHPTMESGFAAARDQLAQRVEAHPDDVWLLSVLGEVDALLGRKQEAIEEATRAVDLRPISQDAVEGPWILQNLAVVYAWTNEPDQAFRELAILVKTPASPVESRATFKLNPFWDPIRNDPRFEQLADQIPAYP